VRSVVLGAGGFIGANLQHRLIELGDEITGFDINMPRFRQNTFIGIDAPSCIIGADLRNLDAVHKAFRGADRVFHLAADMGGVGYFHSDADLLASLDNGLITANVMRVAADTGTPTFYASSACAYPTELMMTEGAPPLFTEDMVGHGTPDALYGAEKLHGLRIAAKIPNVRVGILDTVYGPLQEHEGRRMKFPAAVTTKALAARQTGRLELWGDGSQMRCYLYVDDAIDRIMRIMDADHYAGPVNVAGSGAVTCRDVAEMVLDIVGADADIVTNPAEPSGALARECDSTKFRRLYGPTTETSLRDGFTKFAEWLEGGP